jgi:hypothetical protein
MITSEITGERMRPSVLRVGDKVRNIRTDISRPSTRETLRPGDVGVVVEVKPPRRGVGCVEVDGEEYDDRDQDGYAVVNWPNWGRRIAHNDSEGQSWERAK